MSRTATKIARKRAKISRKVRREVYYRDDLRCVYCFRQCVPFVLPGTPMAATLEHRVCHSKGGDDTAGNLVTACIHCNSRRRDMSMRSWLEQLAAEHGEDHADEVRRQLKNRVRRVLREDEAREWARAIRAEEAEDDDAEEAA